MQEILVDARGLDPPEPFERLLTGMAKMPTLVMKLAMPVPSPPSPQPSPKGRGGYFSPGGRGGNRRYAYFTLTVLSRRERHQRVRRLLHREPFPLYDILRHMGLAHSTRQRPDGSYDILIHEPADESA